MKTLFRFYCVLLAGVASLASAQNYPSRPVKLLMGFPAGGQSDIVARVAAQAWSGVLGQPVARLCHFR